MFRRGSVPFLTLNRFRSTRQDAQPGARLLAHARLRLRLRLALMVANICQERESVYQELKLMKLLAHPNIVGYHDSFLINRDRHMCIVMDYCDGGDLAQRLAAAKRAGRSLPEDQIMHWFVQLVFGLHFMHTNKVLHRDIKTSNLFLLHDGRAVLGDLGISKRLDSTMQMAHTHIGTPYYMSPEIYRNVSLAHSLNLSPLCRSALWPGQEGH